MQPQPTYHDGHIWDDTIVKQLSFIKRHKRYPAKKKLLARVILFVFLVANLAIIQWRGHLFDHIGFQKILFLLPAILVIIFAIAGSASTIVQNFIVIKTNYSATGNTEIVQLFLESQDIEVFQHQQAPELLQIVGERGTNRREIILFIAHDHEILIGGYFTFKPSSFKPVLPYKNRMANRLRDWITIHASDANFVY